MNKNIPDLTAWMSPIGLNYKEALAALIKSVMKLRYNDVLSKTIVNLRKKSKLSFHHSNSVYYSEDMTRDTSQTNTRVEVSSLT